MAAASDGAELSSASDTSNVQTRVGQPVPADTAEPVAGPHPPSPLLDSPDKASALPGRAANVSASDAASASSAVARDAMVDSSSPAEPAAPPKAPPPKSYARASQPSTTNAPNAAASASAPSRAPRVCFPTTMFAGPNAPAPVRLPQEGTPPSLSFAVPFASYVARAPIDPLIPGPQCYLAGRRDQIMTPATTKAIQALDPTMEFASVIRKAKDGQFLRCIYGPPTAAGQAWIEKLVALRVLEVSISWLSGKQQFRVIPTFAPRAVVDAVVHPVLLEMPLHAGLTAAIAASLSAQIGPIAMLRLDSENGRAFLQVETQGADAQSVRDRITSIPSLCLPLSSTLTDWYTSYITVIGNSSTVPPAPKPMPPVPRQPPPPEIARPPKQPRPECSRCLASKLGGNYHQRHLAENCLRCQTCCKWRKDATPEAREEHEAACRRAALARATSATESGADVVGALRSGGTGTQDAPTAVPEAYVAVVANSSEAAVVESDSTSTGLTDAEEVASAKMAAERDAAALLAGKVSIAALETALEGAQGHESGLSGDAVMVAALNGDNVVDDAAGTSDLDANMLGDGVLPSNAALALAPVDQAVVAVDKPGDGAAEGSGGDSYAAQLMDVDDAASEVSNSDLHSAVEEIDSQESQKPPGIQSGAVRRKGTATKPHSTNAPYDPKQRKESPAGLAAGAPPK